MSSVSVNPFVVCVSGAPVFQAGDSVVCDILIASRVSITTRGPARTVDIKVSALVLYVTFCVFFVSVRLSSCFGLVFSLLYHVRRKSPEEIPERPRDKDGVRCKREPAEYSERYLDKEGRGRRRSPEDVDRHHEKAMPPERHVEKDTGRPRRRSPDEMDRHDKWGEQSELDRPWDKDGARTRRRSPEAPVERFRDKDFHREKDASRTRAEPELARVDTRSREMDAREKEARSRDEHRDKDPRSKVELPGHEVDGRSKKDLDSETARSKRDPEIDRRPRTGSPRERKKSVERKRSGDRKKSAERKKSVERRKSPERKKSAERKKCDEHKKSSERKRSSETKKSVERKKSDERKRTCRLGWSFLPCSA